MSHKLIGVDTSTVHKSASQGQQLTSTHRHFKLVLSNKPITRLRKGLESFVALRMSYKLIGVDTNMVTSPGQHFQFKTSRYAI